ncbi:MAG: hypothetical protein H0T47_04870 [Planctomycetaceae bacterium]|nr:hypothetical protein [Planctomycetaceae bacterium]
MTDDFDAVAERISEEIGYRRGTWKMESALAGTAPHLPTISVGEILVLSDGDVRAARRAIALLEEAGHLRHVAGGWWLIPTSDFEDPFVRVNTLWPQKFDTYRKCQRALEKVPNAPGGIRRESRGQRLMVHAADWANYWAARDRERFDALDEADLAARKTDIRQGK